MFLVIFGPVAIVSAWYCSTERGGMFSNAFTASKCGLDESLLFVYFLPNGYFGSCWLGNRNMVSTRLILEVWM